MTKQSKKKPAVYILANQENGTLYTGVTSDLIQRIYEHKNGLKSGFTKKYDCKNLVYFELFDDMENAIIREKQIKGGSRKKKLTLINNANKEWKDLYKNIV